MISGLSKQIWPMQWQTRAVHIRLSRIGEEYWLVIIPCLRRSTSFVKPVLCLFVCRKAVTASRQLSYTNKTSVAITMIAIIEAIGMSREAIHYKLGCGGGIRGEHEVKVVWIGVEES
jgi:hypothetical protein